MGCPYKTISGVLCIWLGQPSSHSPYVLHELPFVERRLLPDCPLQSQGLSKHNCKQRFALLKVGQPTKTTAFIFETGTFRRHGA